MSEDTPGEFSQSGSTEEAKANAVPDFKSMQLDDLLNFFMGLTSQHFIDQVHQTAEGFFPEGDKAEAFKDVFAKNLTDNQPPHWDLLVQTIEEKASAMIPTENTVQALDMLIADFYKAVEEAHGQEAAAAVLSKVQAIGQQRKLDAMRRQIAQAMGALLGGAKQEPGSPVSPGVVGLLKALGIPEEALAGITTEEGQNLFATGAMPPDESWDGATAEELANRSSSEEPGGEPIPSAPPEGSFSVRESEGFCGTTWQDRSEDVAGTPVSETSAFNNEPTWSADPPTDSGSGSNE